MFAAEYPVLIWCCLFSNCFCICLYRVVCLYICTCYLHIPLCAYDSLINISTQFHDYIIKYITYIYIYVCVCV